VWLSVTAIRALGQHANLRYPPFCCWLIIVHCSWSFIGLQGKVVPPVTSCVSLLSFLNGKKVGSWDYNDVCVRAYMRACPHSDVSSSWPIFMERGVNVMQLEATAAPYLIDSCRWWGQHGERTNERTNERTKEHVRRQRQ